MNTINHNRRGGGKERMCVCCGGVERERERVKKEREKEVEGRIKND